ncbi:MAG: SMP-30/gluconolactonase/LRE family protein [Polyangiaceae bacterium]|nr:SMP-30/gluconolactonase/LRE family protein [Polyangiaceae bacterium]
MKSLKSGVSALLAGSCLLAGTSLVGCSAAPGTEGDSADELSPSSLNQAVEEEEDDDDNVVAPDRFCKAADRKVQVSFPAQSAWSRVPGVALNWGGVGQDNVEGPTWFNGALYYSNIGPGNASVIWKLVPGTPAVKFLDVDKAGTNGMGVSFQGKLIAGRQLDGSVTSFKWNNPGKKPTTVAGLYNGKPFNAPNDVTIARDGTVYFTDPSWNVPAGVDYKVTRQGGGDFPDWVTDPITGQNTPLRTEGERVYRVDPEGNVTALDITLADGRTNLRNKPNGIMLSLDEKALFVGGAEGAYRFDLSEDGELSNGVRLFPATNELAEAIAGTDGMARDCAGNIYVTVGGPNRLLVFNAQGQSIGEIPAPAGIDYNTNVTFGGDDGKTLFLTNPNWGGPEAAGVWQVRMNVRGYPQ